MAVWAKCVDAGHLRKQGGYSPMTSAHCTAGLLLASVSAHR